MISGRNKRSIPGIEQFDEHFLRGEAGIGPVQRKCGPIYWLIAVGSRSSILYPLKLAEFLLISF